jgi:hypothetical protein
MYAVTQQLKACIKRYGAHLLAAWQARDLPEAAPQVEAHTVAVAQSGVGQARRRAQFHPARKRKCLRNRSSLHNTALCCMQMNSSLADINNTETADQKAVRDGHGQNVLSSCQ